MTKADAKLTEPDDQPPLDVDRLFRDHNEMLVRFLRARLGSDAEAREAAQEAYVRLLQLDRPDQPSFLRAYLFKVAANVATDLLRRRRSRGVSVSPDEVGAEDPGSAERALGARQQLNLIQIALNELPPRCREAFVLHRYDGLATADIAIQLGVSDRMVRLYLVRALEHIQAALDAHQSRYSK